MIYSVRLSMPVGWHTRHRFPQLVVVRCCWPKSQRQVTVLRTHHCAHLFEAVSHCGVFMGDRLLATVISQQYLYMRENFTYNLPTKTCILAAVVHTEVAAVPVTVDCFG